MITEEGKDILYDFWGHLTGVQVAKRRNPGKTVAVFPATSKGTDSQKVSALPQEPTTSELRKTYREERTKLISPFLRDFKKFPDTKAVELFQKKGYEIVIAAGSTISFQDLNVSSTVLTSEQLLRMIPCFTTGAVSLRKIDISTVESGSQLNL